MASNPAIDQQLYDELLKDSLDVLRVGASEQDSVLEKLEELSKQLKAELIAGEVDQASEADVKKVLERATEIITEAYQGISDEQQVNSESIAEAQNKNTNDLLTEFLRDDPKDAADLATDFADITVQGLPLKDWWEQQAGDLVFNAVQQVRQGIANTESVAQIVGRIVSKDLGSGVMDVAKRNASTLVHTSVQAASSIGRRKAIQDNSDVTKGIRQVSTLDSHTSTICVAYSDAEWDLDYQPIGKHKLPYNQGVPRHFGCRSIEVPITKTFADLGIDTPEPQQTSRASELGQISAKTTFDDFLKRMGTEYQDEVLGAGRADLWRERKITLRDLVSGTGSPLTLEQLRAKAGLS